MKFISAFWRKKTSTDVADLVSNPCAPKPIDVLNGAGSINDAVDVDHSINEVQDNLHIVQIENPVVRMPQDQPDVIQDYYSQWSGETYQLNLKRLNCSCPDYVKRRSDFDKTDPRRVCKHLLDTLKTSNLYEFQDDLCKSVIDSGWVDTNFYTLKINGVTRVGFIYGRGEWINIFVRNRRPNDVYGIYTGKFNDYGLSRSGDYWTYGRAPAGAKFIKLILSHAKVI